MAREGLLDWLFPAKCPFCQQVIGHPGLCAACRAKLPEAAGDQAVRTGAGFGVCVFPLYYEGAVRQSLLQFKFGGKASWAAVYAQLLVPCVAEHLSGEFDCITWVPVSRKRLRQRGYDQAKLLAEAMGKAWDTPPVPLLQKVRDTAAQSLQGDAAARRANVLGVYAASDAAAERRILLVDDILTTGSTLSECARVLRDAGAKQVVCATLAGSRSDESRAADGSKAN